MPDLDHPDKSDQGVESMILAAGALVRPTDSLRPRVLDAGLQWQSDRQVQYRLGRMVIISLAVLAIGSRFGQYAVSSQAKLSSPPAAEVERRAISYSQATGIGADWGLVEVFRQLRNEQAQKLGPNRNGDRIRVHNNN